MKKLNLLISTSLVLTLLSCNNKNVGINISNTTINGVDINIYTIDSCEYIGVIDCNSNDILTHKGNCKYCAYRLKK